MIYHSLHKIKNCDEFQNLNFDNFLYFQCQKVCQNDNYNAVAHTKIHEFSNQWAKGTNTFIIIKKKYKESQIT